MNDIEIELQLKIEHTESLRQFLKEKADFIHDVIQIDTYYIPEHRNFLAVDPVEEWLRLREQGDRYSITCKNWHFDQDGKSHYCDEYETDIGSKEQLSKIFNVLNMKIVATVNKKRSIWNYEDFEIALDQVKGLGDFLEIEYKGKDTDVLQVRNTMLNFIKRFDCGKIYANNRGYPFMILFPERVELEEL